MIYNEIGNILKSNNNFIILTHVSPDGDAIGSSLSLLNALIENGKSCDIIVDDKLPDKYNFLPNYDSITNLININKAYDVVLVLDCGDLERTGKTSDIFNKSNLRVNIDHHITNNGFAEINLIEAEASSTGEIIYQLLRINGYDISKNIAMCLYTSLLSDTGGFKYSNTSSVTLSIAGDLINTGIDFPYINEKIFSSKTIPQIKLLSKVTSTLELYYGNEVAVLTMNRSMLEECNACDEDSGDLVNIARDIDGVEVGVFIKEKDGNICRISMRSKNHVDVKDIALVFNGGGHVRAAGCTIEGSLDNAKSLILNELKKQLNRK